MAKGGEKVSGDKPLIMGVIMTLALGAAMIFGVHRLAIPGSPYPKIDPHKVQQLIHEGKISGQKADYFEEMRSP